MADAGGCRRISKDRRSRHAGHDLLEQRQTVLDRRERLDAGQVGRLVGRRLRDRGGLVRIADAVEDDRRLGLDVPATVLVRADEVIE